MTTKEIVKELSDRTGISISEIQKEISSIMEEQGIDESSALAVFKCKPEVRRYLRGVVRNIVFRTLTIEEPIGGRDWANVFGYVGYNNEYERQIRKIYLRPETTDLLANFTPGNLVEFRGRLNETTERTPIPTVTILSDIAPSKEKFPTAEKLFEETPSVPFNDLERYIGKYITVEGFVGGFIPEHSDSPSGFYLADSESLNTIVVWLREDLETGNKVKIFGQLILSDRNELTIFPRHVSFP